MAPAFLGNTDTEEDPEPCATEEGPGGAWPPGDPDAIALFPAAAGHQKQFQLHPSFVRAPQLSTQPVPVAGDHLSGTAVSFARKEPVRRYSPLYACKVPL